MVEFSLKTKTNPISVTKYHMTEKLPSNREVSSRVSGNCRLAVNEAIETGPDHAWAQ